MTGFDVTHYKDCRTLDKENKAYDNRKNTYETL